MEHIFLTRNAWNRFGGVPGLCLTLQEIGVPKLNLHGPPGIDEIFESTRKFVVLRNMTVEAPECNEGGFFEDSVMRVSYVPLYKDDIKPVQKQLEPVTLQADNADNLSEQPTSNWNKEEPKAFKDETDYFGYENNKGKAKVETKGRTSYKTEVEDAKKLLIDKMVMAYVCKLKERPGTLDFEKCVEKGVTPGPLLGRLKNGYDVKLINGTTVLADEVRGPPSPGSVFIFVDIPDESFLSALTNSEAFDPYQKTAVKEDNVALIVVHFSDEIMMENPTYKEWMNKFSPSTKHWFVNERNEFTGFFAAHRIQRQLNELDDQVFPMLMEPHPYTRPDLKSEFKIDPADENPSKKFKVDTEGEKEEAPVDSFKDYPELGILSLFHIRPAKGFDRHLEPYSNPERVIEESLSVQGLPELINSFKFQAQKLIASRSKAQRDKEYPKVITFGTGSCIPNKTRNVSANLVHIAPDNCALLDCGEGTLGQIIRFYGRDGADEVLKNLRMIYISHLHADHHLGLIDIINRRRKVTSEKLVLLAPAQISAWLAFYNFRIEEIYSTFDLFPCGDLVSSIRILTRALNSTEFLSQTARLEC